MDPVVQLALMSNVHRYLGKSFFWASLILSQIAGMISAAPFYNHHRFFIPLVFQIFTAVLFFMVIYRFLALNVIFGLEHRNGVKINKPGLLRGVLYSIVIPLILCATGFLIILLLSGLSINAAM